MLVVLEEICSRTTLLRVRGAWSGDFESEEQEFWSQFDKYKIFAKNRNSKGIFLLLNLFLVKIGTYYCGSRRAFYPLQ